MKRFLLIAYYWPPCGGVSVQRWLKLTKYFPKFAWLPTMVTIENGDYPYIDESLCHEVSKEIKVVRTKTLSYSKIFKSLLGKKRAFAICISENHFARSFFKKIDLFHQASIHLTGCTSFVE